MTDEELEARAKRAYGAHYENYPHNICWEDLPPASKTMWLAIARAVLAEPAADPFEEWWQRPTMRPWKDSEELARSAWDASDKHATERERQRCLKAVDDAKRSHPCEWLFYDFIRKLKELINSGK